MKGPGIVLLLIVACAACNTPATEPNAGADEAAIRDLIRRTAVANNDADTLAWVALFEANAVYMAPDMSEVTTREGLLGVAAAGFGRFAAEIEITPVEIVILSDWAFARSHVTGAVTPRTGGDPISVDVKQLALYHRQADGGWKIARLIMNANS